MNENRNLKKGVGIHARRLIAYIVLIIVSILCLFWFYVLFINATRSNGELQSGFTLIPSSHLWENWKNLRNGTLPVWNGMDYSVKNGLAVVEVSMLLPVVGAAYQLRYTVNGSGKIQVEAFYKPEKEKIPLMPKFGMRMRLPSSMDYVKWYGRGEFENYPDRKTAALVGCYATDLNSFVTDYAFPQDNANRCDVRWFSLNDKEGRTIKVTGLQPLCFRVWPYGEEDLEKNRHAYELPVRDYVNVNIDLNIHGVGGADSWGARTLDEYTIDGNQAYYYGYLMEYSD